MAPVDYTLSGARVNLSRSLVVRPPSQRAQRPQGFMRLPIEVVLVIAQHLSEASLSGDLAALTLVQYRYAHAVQEVLFSRIHIDSYESYASLTRALQLTDSPEHDRQLGPMVRDLSATLNTQPGAGQKPFLALHLLNLYRQCPRLRHVTLASIRDDGVHEDIPPTAPDLHHIEAIDNVKNLTLVCPLGFFGPLLLQRLPFLTELRIVGGVTAFQLGDRPPRSGLGLRRVTWGSSTPPKLLNIQWLFGYSTEVTGGEINLLTPPDSDSDWQEICNYALQRGMNFRSPPALNPDVRET